MTLELLTVENVQDGLKNLGKESYSMRQNMEARIGTPVLKDETDIWDIWLDSKTMNLYGGVNEDKRHRFKIDHDFGLSMIVNKTINSDCSITINKDTYMNSRGTEFIIISGVDLKGTNDYYAIRTDKYETIRGQLNKRDYNVSDLEKAGGFKITAYLTPEETSASDGWKEFAVGKNNASEKEYEEASRFLEEYVSKAKENNCFRKDGMGFCVRTNVSEFEVRPWFVDSSYGGPHADDRDGFSDSGHFLSDTSAEGAEQKTGHK